MLTFNTCTGVTRVWKSMIYFHWILIIKMRAQHITFSKAIKAIIVRF